MQPRQLQQPFSHLGRGNGRWPVCEGMGSPLYFSQKSLTEIYCVNVYVLKLVHRHWLSSHMVIIYTYTIWGYSTLKQLLLLVAVLIHRYLGGTVILRTLTWTSGKKDFCGLCSFIPEHVPVCRPNVPLRYAFQFSSSIFISFSFYMALLKRKCSRYIFFDVESIALFVYLYIPNCLCQQ